MRTTLVFVLALVTAGVTNMAGPEFRTTGVGIGLTMLPGVLLVYGIYRIGVWRGRKSLIRSMQDAPVTDKQRAYISLLCGERDLEPPDMEDMTRAQASLLIDALKREKVNSDDSGKPGQILRG